jgi:hypothetical protein
MKATIISAIFIISTSIGLKAQNLIALQHNGTPLFYIKLDDAVTNAQNGDSIYIPGGDYSLSVPINKSIHIIGVGHHPDSTRVTGVTSISGAIVLQQGASYGSLSGLSNGWEVNINNDSISHYSISRCSLARVGLGGSNPAMAYCIFSENVIQYGIACLLTGHPRVSYCLFLNNIICGGSYGNMTNCTYKNNIFMVNAGCDAGGWCNYAASAAYSSFESNIFLSNGTTNPLAPCASAIVNNNLFVRDYAIPGSNNIVNQSQSSIFVNQTGDNFNYAHDYHLQASCPGKSAGIDGTDIGIYGGTSPWKEGSIPANPHFQFKSVGGTTDANGNLKVKFKVEAQDH